MNRIKKIFSKANISTEEDIGEKMSISCVDSYYGKHIANSDNEKTKMVASLTPRERETFLILLEGYSLKEVAKQIGIAYSTANTYQTAIYKKLHVNSRAELIINYRDIVEVKEKGSQNG